MLERDAFSRWLGIAIQDVADGQCVARMTVRDEMVNGFGVAHGGIAYSLADSAMAFACNAGEHVTVAVDNSISYPAPVRVGDVLTARATQDAVTGRLAFYRVVVTNQADADVAIFRGTVYRTRQQHSGAQQT